MNYAYSACEHIEKEEKINKYTTITTNSMLLTYVKRCRTSWCLKMKQMREREGEEPRNV